MSQKKGSDAPVQKNVKVECSQDEAFRFFTEDIAHWWPKATCVIEPWVGGRVFERARSGEEHDWGTVTVWDPPSRLEFTWHSRDRRDVDEMVSVEFLVEADGTRVTLTHSGWQSGVIQNSAIQASAVLEQFEEFVADQVLIMC
jgi:hypothetical protein